MTATQKHAGGRPSLYTPALVEHICLQLAEGIPLAVICRQEKTPDQSTVWDWMQSKPEVSQAIARAREDGWDMIAYTCRQTARGGGDSKDEVRRDKLIIETDLKLLAKWDPKRYGDKQTIDLNAEFKATSDPLGAMDQLVTLATANPTMGPMIREWAEQLLQRLPKIAE